MKLFCYIQIKGQQEIEYTFYWKNELTSAIPNLTFIDADNHSEGFLIAESCKLMQEASQIICYFEVSENEPLGSISKVLEFLRKSKVKKLIIVKGINEPLSKTLKFFGNQVISFSNEADILLEIRGFLNT